MSWLRVWSVGAALLGLVAACGSDDGSGGQGGAGGGAAADAGYDSSAGASGGGIGGASGGSGGSGGVTGGSGGGGAGGSSGNAGSAGTGGSGCDNPAQCPNPGGQCLTATCVGGVCGSEAVPAGSACSESGGTLCDGSGACVECLSGSDCASLICQQNQCVGAQCVDTVKNGNETDIDCGGPDCAPCADGKTCGGATDCASGFCAQGVCAPCASHTDCASGNYCLTGACTPTKANGVACGEAAECTSGQCPAQDGVCCDTACTSACSACTAAKTGGVDGTCSNVTANADPDNECSDQGAASCGSSGACDGAGACAVYASGTECAPQSCSGGTQTNASTCNGSGSCAAGGTTSCGLYACGPAACKTSCTSDNDCAANAYCSGTSCVPKAAPGQLCAAGNQCASGFCVDGVCCTSACVGACRSCNVTGSAGSCVNLPANTDPHNECPGFSCAGYYTGFGTGQDACYHRQDVSAAQASCNGAGACATAATVCPTQPPGPVQIDCNNQCQSPLAGTCTGTVAGICTNLDDPATTTTCGLGACQNSVQKCVGGQPSSCTPGLPTAETCNTIDDDCDGVADDGAGSNLCPAAPFAASYACTAGVCSFSCVTGRHDFNQVYADGCECADDTHGNSCSLATTLPAMSTPGAAISYTGVIVPNGESDWFSIGFPISGNRGPAQGVPRVALTGPNASNFVLDMHSTCSTNVVCGSGSATGISAWEYRDNQSSGLTQYKGPHSSAWPSMVLFRVQRIASVATCNAAAYTVTVSR